MGSTQPISTPNSGAEERKEERRREERKGYEK
jgi:hypothetical protein